MCKRSLITYTNKAIQLFGATKGLASSGENSARRINQARAETSCGNSGPAKCTRTIVEMG